MAKTLTMGTKLTLKKKAGESNDVILKSLVSVGEISGETEEIDVTTLDSEGGAKEYISGATDWGEQEIEGMVDDADQLIKLRGLFDSGEVRDWEIETPAKHKIAYKAFIKAFTYSEKTIDGVDKFSMTLRLSGKATFTKGA